MARKRSARNSPDDGVYYLGRVIKLGVLDDETIIHSLLNPAEVRATNNEWTVVEAKHLASKGHSYVFGKLAKYKPTGTVDVIDKQRHQSVTREQPNLLIASSPFVYLPAFSGVAHLYVANQIENSVFEKRFAEIIETSRGKFFVECSVEPVGDLEGFIAKVIRLEAITEISARVNPPNPLYGPLWGLLGEYLKKRKAVSLAIDEALQPDTALNTKLVDHLQSKQEGASVSRTADAAILMAIDGYGKGAVKGRRGRRRIVVKTMATVKNFSFTREPEPEELYERAAEAFQAINYERRLKH